MTAARILVVQGNAGRRELMRAALADQGCAVVVAGDGESALHLAAEQTPALVVLDVKLPGMDGFEVGRRLSALAPGVPVIAVAGWAQADEARLHAARFLDVLVKPVDPRHLVEVVGRHLGRMRPRAERPGRTVLLVEDDPTQRKLAQLLLTDAGFDVTVAEDGEEALRLASTGAPPDVIVSDVLMPRMDGFALSKAVRGDPRLARVPIVLMSAHYLEAEDRELAGRFAASYVSRTSGFDIVLRAVDAAIDGPAIEPVPPSAAESEHEHVRRITHQLERQAGISVGLVQRLAVQASALSVLDGLADSLARETDPESGLVDTLAGCLEAAGLSMGAVLLRPEIGCFILKAHLGVDVAVDWARHFDLFEGACGSGGLAVPSKEAGNTGDELLVALGATHSLVVPMIARGETLGVLLLASNGTDLAGIERESAVRAARSVATHLGQALALSRVFGRLSAAEQRYRALLENAHDCIVVSTPSGVLLEVNRRMEQVLGLPRDKVVGRRMADFAAQSVVESNVAAYEAVVAGGEGAAPPVVLQRPDGSVIHVEFSTAVVEVGGERCVFSVGRDVSERLRLEEQLRQSQKMDAIGRLAGGIAHDFNNVLSVILSYSDLLMDELKPGEPIREDIDEIRKAGNRAADLTRQLLTFSRQQVVQPKIVDLNEVLSSIDRMLQRILGTDVELVSIPEPNLGRVRIDPGSMEQVIMNLVVNARDAMPRGGKLTMETANVTLDETFARQHRGARAGPHVMLSITDSGAGMDRATQARIFEPFFTTKPLGKGTGLGLSTVFGIVHQGGGSIWVYSEPGHGTTFKVYLPRLDGATKDPVRVSQRPSTSCGGTETVLLVEDDDQVRSVARSILQKHGYRVLEARNAGEGLLHSEGHPGPIDLLLTDVVMPQISGPDFAKRLAVLRPDMKVLCMSGYTDDSIVRHGVLEASMPYLQKPFTPIALASRVRAVLDAPMAGRLHEVLA